MQQPMQQNFQPMPPTQGGQGAAFQQQQGNNNLMMQSQPYNNQGTMMPMNGQTPVSGLNMGPNQQQQQQNPNFGSSGPMTQPTTTIQPVMPQNMSPTKPPERPNESINVNSLIDKELPPESPEKKPNLRQVELLTIDNP